MFIRLNPWESVCYPILIPNVSNLFWCYYRPIDYGNPRSRGLLSPPSANIATEMLIARLYQFFSRNGIALSLRRDSQSTNLGSPSKLFGKKLEQKRVLGGVRPLVRGTRNQIGQKDATELNKARSLSLKASFINMYRGRDVNMWMPFWISTDGLWNISLLGTGNRGRTLMTHCGH